MAEARTVAEAYAYLELTLPPGESWVDYEKYTTLDAGPDGGYVLRFDGWYEGERHRLDVPVVAREGRSTLIDAGQWHLLEDAYAGMAATGEEQLAGAAPDDETYRAIVGAWDGAATAAAEIELFLPEGADEPAGEAFWTAAGRGVREHRPEAFGRARLAAARAEYTRRRDEFVARYGMAAEETAGETTAAEPVRAARTYGEAHTFMDLHPCECGSAAFPRGQLAVLGSDDHGVTVRFAGRCDDCDRSRAFVFRLPPRPGVPAESPYLFGYPEDGPSELLDAGEWFGVAEGYAAVADLAVAEVDSGDQEDVVKLLTCAASAVDEVLRFLPAGADVLPAGALWTAASREGYARDPARFRRASLEQWRAERWRRLAEYAGRGESP
ncbi:hypothetical protein WEI85_09965 [Actinomycetes bacterium KLBMP 9797]